MSAAPDEAEREWRELVFPSGYRNPEPADRYNLVVVGAGPAGLVASIAAAGLGARVALVERHAMGGDCLNVGCVPSKTVLSQASAGRPFSEAFAEVRRVRAAIAHHDSVERYAAAGVHVFLGDASFEDAHTVRVGELRLRARKTLIATGARPLIPAVPGLRELDPLTNETVFAPRSQPARLAVLGGGPIGCELAQAFARLGTEVDLIEMQPRLLPSDEPDAAAVLARALEADGVRLHLGVGVKTGARSASGRKALTLSDARLLEVDEVLVAAGRVRNVDGLELERAGVHFDARTGITVNARLQTSHPDIYAAGDVSSRLQFTHAADAQARIVVRNALFLGRARADRLVIPWCTYTRPEVAHVGDTRAALQQAGHAFVPLRVNFAELDRGRTDAAGDGFAEVLLAAGTDRILGATIVGKDAGEQIALLVLMMSAGLGLGAVSSLVLPYPTRAEYLRRMADAWNRSRLTPATAGLLRWWLRRTR
ncbi:MAG: FAD-dependent oxidoreductase [Steroidobacteraceae bacterium]